VVVAADDVRDPVPHVFHRRGEVVRGPSVGAHEHEILDRLVRHLDAAAHDVVPRRRALVGHAETNRALVLVRSAVRDELLGGAPAVVEAVELERDGAVPLDTQPAERLLDLLDGLGDLAARVGVLDAQPVLAPVLAREEIVEEKRPHAADVKKAGRARRHTNDRCHGG